MTREFQTSRRAFLALAATGAAAAALAGPRGPASAGRATNARIVIIGAGAAGTALVNRLVDRLEGAQITLIDPRAEHLYQPGLTLVAAGLKPAELCRQPDHRLAARWRHADPRAGRGGRPRGADRLDRGGRDAGL
jgi:hypothetical protein